MSNEKNKLLNNSSFMREYRMDEKIQNLLISEISIIFKIEKKI